MNHIEFSWDEMAAFAKLIVELNKNGVPYSLKKDSIGISVTIHNGY